MSSLISARAQMGTSLAFHIIFSALGVGLPLLLCIAEGIGYFRRESVWYRLAQTWQKPFAILYAVGGVSGTIISFELGLLWPTFMHKAGQVIGLPFALEAFAFFTEAIFLGLYLYTWDRVAPLTHWLFSFPLWIAGLLSSMFVVSANAWMNTPAGFKVVNGALVGVDPWQAFFNHSAIVEGIHMSIAAYMATGFGVAAIYAFAILRGKNTHLNRMGLLLSLAVGGLATPLMAWSGDSNAKVVATYQPLKLATMEGLFHTTRGAPETILGWADVATGHTYFGLSIGNLLSFLAYSDPNATVKGLDAFPRADWPNGIPILHLAFDSMVGIGFLGIAVAAVFGFLFFRRKRQTPTDSWLLWGIFAMGFLSFIAIELGWAVTEEGRQPWIIYHLLRVSDAVTPASWMSISFTIFTLVYLALGFTTVRLIMRATRGEEPSHGEEVA